MSRDVKLSMINLTFKIGKFYLYPIKGNHSYNQTVQPPWLLFSLFFRISGKTVSIGLVAADERNLFYPQKNRT